jgi:hypothetical protein
MNGDDRMVELMEELVAWTKFAHQEALITVWRKVIVDEKHLVAYELTDGTRTQRDVAEASGLSQPTISALWQKWRRTGLARELPGGKVRHLARPSDFGIVATPKKARPSGQKTNPGEEK